MKQSVREKRKTKKYGDIYYECPENLKESRYDTLMDHQRSYISRIWTTQDTITIQVDWSRSCLNHLKALGVSYARWVRGEGWMFGRLSRRKKWVFSKNDGEISFLRNALYVFRKREASGDNKLFVMACNDIPHKIMT